MTKKDKKTNRKLTSQDYARMWGEDGPYSQVRLCEETRILDARVSRVFLVVEADINPFTLEYAQKHRDRFTGDEPVLQLLDHAEYRGKFGYVVAAGEVELRDEGSREFARKQADMTTQALIRMHTFVMGECGLKHDTEYGVVEDTISHNAQYMWNGKTGSVEQVDNELWGKEALIGSSSGVRNNKMRFFFVFAFVKSPDLKKASATAFAKTLKEISARLDVEIEDAEMFQAHALVTALIPFDLAPALFAETALNECNAAVKKPLFQKDYFVTNVKKLAPEQIMSFLHQLPLNKDTKFPL